MSLSQKIKNYLINFSGISWDETKQRYNVEFNPLESKKKRTLDSYKPCNKNKKEFDYTYGGQAKFNTRDVLKENEAYRDTVYTNYLGKDKDGKDKFDLPTLGYGQTLKYALAKDDVEMTDKFGNKKRQSGAKWHEELDKNRHRLVQGSGSKQGKAYYDGDEPIEWHISKDEGERLQRVTGERYLNQAKKVADKYAEKYGSQYSWENLSPLEQMQVFQATYGGSFTGSQTHSGNSINKGSIYGDMKRDGIDFDKATDEEISNYLDNWYKKNIKSPGSSSRAIAGRRYNKTRGYYQKRNCKE